MMVGIAKIHSILRRNTEWRTSKPRATAVRGYHHFTDGYVLLKRLYPTPHLVLEARLNVAMGTQKMRTELKLRIETECQKALADAGIKVHQKHGIGLVIEQ